MKKTTVTLKNRKKSKEQGFLSRTGSKVLKTRRKKCRKTLFK